MCDSFPDSKNILKNSYLITVIRGLINSSMISYTTVYKECIHIISFSIKLDRPFGLHLKVDPPLGLQHNVGPSEYIGLQYEADSPSTPKYINILTLI